MKIAPFRIERFFSEHEFSTPYILCASDCESMSVSDLLSLEQDSMSKLERLRLGYTETRGSLRLRRAIADLYENLDADDIVVHGGGEEVIFTFMHAALEPGDHVIVHQPSYQSLYQVPFNIGCDVTPWEARASAGWRLDLDELESLVRPETRLVVVNTPHSPTGYLMTEAEQRRLIDFAAARDLLVFSDEAYRGLEYDESCALPAACDLYEGAACLGLLSKGYGLPGLRIGWIASRDPHLRERMLRVKDYTSICNAAPSEFFAEIALAHGPTLLKRSRDIIVANLDALSAFMTKHEERFDWTPPEAGPVTFPTLRGEESVEEFCEVVRRDAGVLLLPGTLFREDSREFRVGLGRKNTAEALERLEDFLPTLTV